MVVVLTITVVVLAVIGIAAFLRLRSSNYEDGNESLQKSRQIPNVFTLFLAGGV